MSRPGGLRVEVRHQIRRHLGYARRGADRFLQRRPATLQLGPLALFLVFGRLIDLVVDGGHLVGLDAQPGEPALVVDGHRGAIFLGQRLRDAAVAEEDRALLLGHAINGMPQHYATATIARLVEVSNTVQQTRDRTTLLCGSSTGNGSASDEKFPSKEKQPRDRNL